MRSKQASQCHELSCAALVMAMAAAATATVGGAAAGVRAAPAHPLAFGVASPARRFASRGGSTVTMSAAKQRVQVGVPGLWSLMCAARREDWFGVNDVGDTVESAMHISLPPQPRAYDSSTCMTPVHHKIHIYLVHKYNSVSASGIDPRRTSGRIRAVCGHI